MKKVLLMNDGKFFWQTVEVFLGGINAGVRTIDTGAPEEAIAGEDADLLLLGAGQYRARGVPRGCRKAIVIDDEGSLCEVPDTLRRGVSCLQWPCEREHFLEKTASTLGVAPRKIFKAVIRIFVPAAQYGAVGESSDFSMTGMSFTSESFFATGQKISVSLSLPGGKQSILLGGRVTRSKTDDGNSCTLYGVEFGDFDRATGEALKAFVLS
jgi:hypothetical protein